MTLKEFMQMHSLRLSIHVVRVEGIGEQIMVTLDDVTYIDKSGCPVDSRGQGDTIDTAIEQYIEQMNKYDKMRILLASGSIVINTPRLTTFDSTKKIGDDAHKYGVGSMIIES